MEFSNCSEQPHEMRVKSRRVSSESVREKNRIKTRRVTRSDPVSGQFEFDGVHFERSENLHKRSNSALQRSPRKAGEAGRPGKVQRTRSGESAGKPVCPAVGAGCRRTSGRSVDNLGPPFKVFPSFGSILAGDQNNPQKIQRNTNQTKFVANGYRQWSLILNQNSQQPGSSRSTMARSTAQSQARATGRLATGTESVLSEEGQSR